jgi:hypothetical protein
MAAIDRASGGLFPEHGFLLRLEGFDNCLTKFAKPRFMLGSIGC